MPADLLSDSLLYIVSYMRRLLVEQQALEHVPAGALPVPVSVVEGGGSSDDDDG